MEYCFTTNFDLLETEKLLSPWLLALVVYWVWHKQKGKEVISNESIKIINKLNEIRDISEKMYVSFIKNSDDYFLESQSYYKIQRDIEFNLKTLNSLIKAYKNKKDTKLEELISDFRQTSIIFLGKINYIKSTQKEIPIELDSQIITSFQSYKDIHNQIKFHLALYAIYKSA